ncbi:hypothetical protein F4212_09375, partial [Candidatus Poribacteria bacterium]|nr:hypothetical protein [Candidatus Poribacteria bacterium]
MNLIASCTFPCLSDFSILMGSDSCSPFSPLPVVGNNFSINFEANNKAHADEIFTKLTDGGTQGYLVLSIFS